MKSPGEVPSKNFGHLVPLGNHFPPQSMQQSMQNLCGHPAMHISRPAPLAAMSHPHELVKSVWYAHLQACSAVNLPGCPAGGVQISAWGNWTGAEFPAHAKLCSCIGLAAQQAGCRCSLKKLGRGRPLRPPYFVAYAPKLERCSSRRSRC